MIRIVLGGVGSGKTARIVKEIVTDKTNRVYFSNIKTKKTKNNKHIDSSMIIKKEIIKGEGKKKDKEEISLNIEYWKKINKKYGAISVVIDEAHSVLNPRRAMSKINIIMTDFLALLRRVLGSDSAGYGELVLITQLERRIDPIAREMATAVHYHICHYQKACKKCGFVWAENNEEPEPRWECLKCGSYHINKFNHIIEVFHFRNMKYYENWKEFGMRSYHRHYYIKDIEDYFGNYDTLQWENLISDY
ncbi:MAG: zonular occludens toxin domain-containing protein [Bacillota bacterium]